MAVQTCHGILTRKKEEAEAIELPAPLWLFVTDFFKTGADK